MQKEFVEINELGFIPTSIKPKIIRYFPDTNLRAGHKGLAEIAKKHKINVKELAAGEYCIFTNKARNAIKMYASGNTIAHHKDPNNRRINPLVIKYLPLFFNGKKIDYDKALDFAIRKEFPDLQ
jgi:hypothetical protein